MYSQRLAENLNNQRKDGSFCDVFIKCGEQVFRAHRAVLVASCEYFKVLFTTQMKEKDSQVISVDVPAEIADDLLSFLYTGVIELNSENTRDLLIAADYLMLGGLKEICEEYITCHLVSLDTCVAIYSIALDYNCKKLASSAEKLLLKEFLELKESDEFLTLSFRHFERIIASDDLVVEEELDVYRSVISWLERAPPDQLAFSEKIFKHVRLCSIDVETITSVIAKNPLVRNSEFCMSLVLRRIKSSLLDNNASQQERRLQQRKCLRAKNLVVVSLGGIANGKTLQETLMYAPVTDTVTKLPNMSNGRDEHVAVVGNNKLYVIGGIQTPNKIECYDPASNSWSPMMPLPNRVISSSAVYHHNKIFIFGGRDGFECVSTAQCYDTDSQTTEVMPRLTFSRKAANAIEINGDIYLIGGCTYDNDSLDSTERLRIGNDLKWERRASMLSKRKYSCACVTSSGRILIAGGYHGTCSKALTSCEVYDLQHDQWQALSNLIIPRGAAGMGRIGDRVFILGGKSDRKSTDTIEWYEEGNDEWNLLETRLPYACAWHKCGVLEMQ